MTKNENKDDLFPISYFPSYTRPGFVAEKDKGVTVGELMRKCNKEISGQVSEVVFNYLKEQGFRPRDTDNYIKNLQKRLKKLGKKLVVAMPVIPTISIDSIFDIRSYVQVYIANIS